MKSTEFLQSAMDVQKERGEQYDKPSGERSMGATVRAFNAITGHVLEESDGWMLLGLLKLVRQAQNPEKYHHDSALDYVAYASLYAEAASEQCGQFDGVEVDCPFDWSIAPSWANWIATDIEGAHYYEDEPKMKRGYLDNWDYPARSQYDTIHQKPSSVAKYPRPQ